MRTFISIWLMLGTFAIKAQSVLSQYTIQAKRSQTCEAFITLELFDKQYRKDSLNQYIINELIKYHYGVNNPGLLVPRFYANTKYANDAPLNINIAGMNTFSSKGVYSFVACPINACSDETYSNYEAVALTLDSATGKALRIADIIEPQLLDSFEAFVLVIAQRYAIRNMPTGYITSLSPIDVRSSNQLSNPVNVLSYHKGLQPQFYVRNNFIMLYNYASNTDYPYKAVEVALPLNLASYFLRKRYREVFLP
ncbi:MAG: hypothetical protein ACK45I_04820 [Bacteroidota bacterium]|jgi:hypothetical protein